MKFYFFSTGNFSIQKSAIKLGFLPDSLFVSSLSDVFFTKFTRPIKKGDSVSNLYKFDEEMDSIVNEYLSFLPYTENIFVHAWKYKKNDNNYLDWSNKNKLLKIGKRDDNYREFEDMYAELSVPAFWGTFWDQVLDKLRSEESKISFFKKNNFIPVFIEDAPFDYYEEYEKYDSYRFREHKEEDIDDEVFK